MASKDIAISTDHLTRLEAALAAGALPALAVALRAEGLTIWGVYHLMYGAFQTMLRSAARGHDVAALLRACESVQHALGGTFEEPVRARIERSLTAGALHALVVHLHDRESWSKKKIYETLVAFTFVLRMEARDDHEILVDDALDALSGWSGTHLWPDESYR